MCMNVLHMVYDWIFVTALFYPYSLSYMTVLAPDHPWTLHHFMMQGSKGFLLLMCSVRWPSIPVDLLWSADLPSFGRPGYFTRFITILVFYVDSFFIIVGGMFRFKYVFWCRDFCGLVWIITIWILRTFIWFIYPSYYHLVAFHCIFLLCSRC